METRAVMAPPPPKRLDELSLPEVFMRDIALKTVFRKNATTVTHLSRAMCLPIGITQEIIDIARAQGLLEAMGTLNASGSTGMPYQLTDSGKARALDALAQSEYFGPMPVPLDIYREQVKRQSIRNVRISREQLLGAMGHLILPEHLISHLGPAELVVATRSRSAAVSKFMFSHRLEEVFGLADRYVGQLVRRQLASADMIALTRTDRLRL